MAGIYLHIPFCKQACHYCNFHFSTSLKQKDAMVLAILKELDFRKNYLKNEPIKTIYFGGGTPSLLDRSDLENIFKKINSNFVVDSAAEITLEANPDDLNIEKLRTLADLPVNRLSIGVQSFSDTDLQFMNRAHQASEAMDCIENAKKMGFENLTIDLIYGTPTMTDAQWKKNLDLSFQFEIPHLSCYSLTVEPKTALAHFVKNKTAPPVDEDQSARQFEYLMERTTAADYLHYEISNFAKDGWFSKHNSAYWLGEKYMGIGPAAHSFDGKTRQWNVANNAKYIKALDEGTIFFEKEILTPESAYNEYILTSLRTIWGTDLNKIIEQFQPHFLKSIQSFLDKKEAYREGDLFFLTQKGKLIADHIAVEVFL